MKYKSNIPTLCYPNAAIKILNMYVHLLFSCPSYEKMNLCIGKLRSAMFYWVSKKSFSKKNNGSPLNSFFCKIRFCHYTTRLVTPLYLFQY